MHPIRIFEEGRTIPSSRRCKGEIVASSLMHPALYALAEAIHLQQSLFQWESMCDCLRADQLGVEWIIEACTYCPEVKTCTAFLHHIIRACCSLDPHHLDCLRTRLGTDEFGAVFTNVLSEQLKATLEA